MLTIPLERADQPTPGPAELGRLAVVGPTFFSYTQAIAGEFRARGFEVAEFDEKHSNRNIAKIMYRLGLGFNPLSPQPRHLSEMADRIIAGGLSDVFLVGVEVISRAFVAKLTAAGLRVHLYMWDGRANKGRFQQYLDLLSSAATFDVRDAEELGMAYVPLFAEELFDTGRNDAGDEFDIGFCGTVHSARVGAIARLLSAEWAKRLRLGLMLYYHSPLLFLMKSVAQPAALRLLPRVSGKSFPKAEVARLFASSRYVLDIPHPGQTGLTARTFEALLSGTRLLTFNAAAAHHLPASIRSRVTIVERIDDIAAIDFAATDTLPPLNEEDRYFLSLRRFVDQLLEGMKLPTHARANPA